jgi:hypothetical protein
LQKHKIIIIKRIKAPAKIYIIKFLFNEEESLKGKSLEN